ncbi:M6 family metalloprotease domain-containing protein [bacterium]|nr:M6 family metalloprotease domain-containing protein [bacterium]
MSYRHSLFTAIALALIILPAAAMPPHPDLVDRIDRGEQPLPYALQHRAELMARGVDTPPEAVRWNSGELDDINFNTLLLLLDFSDNVQNVDATDFDSLMYGNYFGTVKHFYQDASYGNFFVQTENFPGTIGWLRMPETYDYYVDGQNGYGDYPANVQGMVVDAINAADEFVNFADYDNDDNGAVDGLMIVHAGRGAEFTGSDNMIWSHSWSIPTQTLDGVTIRRYVTMPEYWSSHGDMTCGVFAHEMGHMIFGLPDLYDTDYSSNGVGDWSLMAGGSWNGNTGNSPAHPDAWCRVQMGFLEATEITENGPFSFPQVATNEAVYRVQSAVMNPNEYFLVENRQRTSYDAALPSDGLLIWHIDENVNTGNSMEWYPGFENQGHYLVAIEQADGNWSLEHDSGSGDGGDPFPGSTNATAFDGQSIPSSNSYNGDPTFVGIVNISPSAETMSANVVLTPLPAPHTLDYTIDVESGEATFSWMMDGDVSDVLGYTVYRDGALIGNAEEMTFSDELPEMETHYTYTVSAVWPEGESIYNPSIDVFWPGAAAPKRLRYEVVDLDNRVINLMWNQWRSDSLLADDGSYEQNTYLSSNVPSGPKLAQRLTAPADGFVSGVRIWFNDNATFELGEVRVRIYTDNNDTPGAEIYASGVFIPESTGWITHDLGEQAVMVADGADIWVAVEWVETGHSMIGRDVSSEYRGRAAIALDGSTWQGLDEALNGILEGNPLIRAEFGRDEAVGVMGLQEFEVYRDDELLATITDTQYEDTLPEEGVYTYHVDAIYVQGTSSSENLNVDTNTLDVPAIDALPTGFAIGNAYPNPFNPSVAVAVTLGRTSDVRFQVFDVLGRQVADVRRDRLSAGSHTLSWTADGVASGVYFLRIQAGPETAMRKVVLMR